MSEFELKEGLFKDIPSNTYHGTPNTFSSSNLKEAFKNLKFFHKKCILREVEKEEKPAFDIGTYFHTEILEPEKIQSECAVFDGIRRGEKWETFKAANAGKAIITKSEYDTAKVLIDACRASEIAMARIARCEAEVSGFLKLRVVGDEIFCPSKNLVMGKHGWAKAVVPNKGTDIWVKVRADAKAETFIADLKSMTGDAEDEKTIVNAIYNYGYDLSAAFYLDIFSALETKTITEFLWIFASKDFGNCKSYVADEDVIMIGRHKWKKAILKIAEGIESNWEFPEYIGYVKPPFWEYEHLKTKDEDLL